LVERAADRSLIRTDLPPARLTEWIMLVLDGFVGRIAAGAPFEPENEGPMLHDAVARLLAP